MWKQLSRTSHCDHLSFWKEYQQVLGSWFSAYFLKINTQVQGLQSPMPVSKMRHCRVREQRTSHNLAAFEYKRIFAPNPCGPTFPAPEFLHRFSTCTWNEVWDLQKALPLPHTKRSCLHQFKTQLHPLSASPHSQIKFQNYREERDLYSCHKNPLNIFGVSTLFGEGATKRKRGAFGKGLNPKMGDVKLMNPQTWLMYKQ